MKKVTLKNIKAYIQGNLRYRLFYSRLQHWLPEHILQQIEYRLETMNPSCYSSGSCVKCGCSTTALQMANKSCDGNCYPPMMTERQFLHYIVGQDVVVEGNTWRLSKNSFLEKGSLYTVYKVFLNEELVHNRKKKRTW